MGNRISFSEKDADLLYEVAHHCNEHQTWMWEVFDNGAPLDMLETRLVQILNEIEMSKRVKKGE